MLYDLTHDMEVGDQYHRVTCAYQQALAYVWGRQDAGEGERDTGLSERFATAFAAHVKDYVTGRHHTMTNLQDAYQNWNKDGTILA